MHNGLAVGDEAQPRNAPNTPTALPETNSVFQPSREGSPTDGQRANAAPHDVTYYEPPIILGAEYSFLKKEIEIERTIQAANAILGTEPIKKKKRIIPDGMTLADNEADYIWANRTGKIIYMPVYEAYNKVFWDNLVEGTKIKTAFDDFHDTSIYERYITNAMQFSAAKSAAEAKAMQTAVFDENRVVKSYSAFKRDAMQIAEVFNETYLRVERDMSIRQAVQAEKWDRMVADKDINGDFWVYKGIMDDREREEHVEMEGKVFKIGDPDGDAIFPPIDWNCLKINELVLTNEGWKPINTLQIGETVIGGSGNNRTIRFVHINYFSGKLIGIITKNSRVFYTDNHRILTIKGWVAAGNNNPFDIVINDRKPGVFNGIITYVNNCYSFGRNIFMPNIVKWYSGMVEAFNSNIECGNKNINPIRRTIEVMYTLVTQLVYMLNHFSLGFIRRSSGVNVHLGVGSVKSNSGSSHFSPNFWPSGRGNSLHEKSLFSNPFTGFFGKAKIWMRNLGNVASHFASLAFFPFICIYPLALYCITAFSNWYIAMVEKHRDNPVVSYFPAFAKFSESIKLNRVKFIKNNGEGAPLDKFNSRLMFLYNCFVHKTMIIIEGVKIEQYSGNVYNLDVDIDNSYITKTGIVHNCRCTGEALDEDEVKEAGGKISTHEEAAELLNTHVNEQFRYNPSTQGMMPRTGSYFEVLPSANAATPDMFQGGEDAPDTNSSTVFLVARGLHSMLEQQATWAKEYHTNRNGDIIFQNARTLTNITFTNNSLHTISGHPKGFELLPETLEHAEEIWASWADEKQLVVKRVYVKGRYVVETINGVVTNGLLLSAGGVAARKKGIILKW